MGQPTGGLGRGGAHGEMLAIVMASSGAGDSYIVY